MYSLILFSSSLRWSKMIKIGMILGSSCNQPYRQKRGKHIILVTQLALIFIIKVNVIISPLLTIKTIHRTSGTHTGFKNLLHLHSDFPTAGQRIASREEYSWLQFHFDVFLSSESEISMVLLLHRWEKVDDGR